LAQRSDAEATRIRLRKLYEALVAPVQAELQGIDRLAILPSRALHYVPFPALLRRTGSQDRFLIEDKEIVQLSGAAFSALQDVRPRERRPQTLAALADPANNLRDARDEVNDVRQFFPLAHVLVGDEATSRGLNGVLEGASVFHYAGHARPDPKMPGAGYLELAQPDTPEGRLTVSQIRGLPMAGMELVTLSACEASQGQGEPRGLAIASLSDAFMMAGAHSVIGTLWKVDDAGTRQLMGEFYRRLTAGSCKGASLREAQLALLRGRKFANPYYWAAFSLFGDWGDLNGRRACAFTRR
jgi:CHAT domain-containing protein